MNVRFDSTSVVVSVGRVSMPGSNQSWDIAASASYVGSERSGAAMMSSKPSDWASVSAEIRWLTIRTIVTVGSSAATMLSRSESKPPLRLVWGKEAASDRTICRSMITFATSDICCFNGATTCAGIAKFRTGAAGSVYVPVINSWNTEGVMVDDAGALSESAETATVSTATPVGPWLTSPGCAAMTSGRECK